MAFAFALIACLPFVNGGWVWDDHVLLESGTASLLELWRAPVGAESTGPGASYYRPLALTVMHGLSGLGGARAIHLAAGLLHGFSAVFLLSLLPANTASQRWRQLPWALLFAAHPVAAEVLGWASAFPDALATTFGLATLWAAQRGHLGTVMVCALGALLSKETGIVFLTIAPWCARPQIRRAMGFAVVVSACIWLVLRFYLAHTATGITISDFTGLVEAPFELASLLVWPFPSTAVRDAWLLGLGRFVVGAAVIVLLMIRGGLKNHYTLAALAGICIAAPIVAHSHLVADRYLYPVVACAILALGREPLSARSGQILAALAVASGLTILAPGSARWKSDVTLFSAATRAQPSSAYAWHLLGVAHSGQDDHAAAAQAFSKALGLEHALAETPEFYLVALVEAGQPATATEWIARAPSTNVSARYVAYAARAFFAVGQTDRAAANLATLDLGGGRYDGPTWVPQLAKELSEPTSAPMSKEETGQLPPSTP